MTAPKKKGVRKSASVSPPREEHFVLLLYVTGMTPNSTRAIANAKALCERHFKGHYDLKIIDIYQQPALAKGEQIIAVPTLVKKLPTPLRHLVGDLSEIEHVLLGLDLRPHTGKIATTASRNGLRSNK